MVTFEEHVLRQDGRFGADFGWVLSGLVLAVRRIEREIRSAGLSGVYGALGQENVQGETQQKLDVVANDLIKDCLRSRAAVAALVSEEDEGCRSVFDEDPDDGQVHRDLRSAGWVFEYRRECECRERSSVFISGLRQEHRWMSRFCRAGTKQALRRGMWSMGLRPCWFIPTGHGSAWVYARSRPQGRSF